MVMSAVLCGIFALSLAVSLFTGTWPVLTAALFDGAASAVKLTLSLAGTLCFWSGVIRVTEECGLSDRLSALFRPLLRLLFPEAAGDEEARASISGNLTANLLGLGNAATPFGLKAISRLARMERVPGRASDEMCRLVVCNAASLQLIPTTVAAVRLAAGCERPFDILPAVWLCSIVALCVGLGMCAVLRRIWRE